MEAPKVTQKEYLKRYLSKDDGKKKKKKRKLKVGTKTVQLIDDDIDFKKLTSIDDDEISILNTTEDAPQIAGIIDERGPIDFGDKQRWKLIADDGTGDIAITKVPRRDAEENINDNSVESKKESKLDSKENKLKKRKKAKSKSSSSSSSSEDEREKSKRKKRKGSLKRKKKTRKRESSSSDSESESDSSSSNKRKKSDSDDDFNIPNAKSIEKHSRSDRSPPRKKKLKQSESSNKYDNPSRNSKREKTRGDDSDLSPPRNSKRDKAQGYNSDLSPPRNSKRGKAQGYNSDLSPPRNSKRKKARGDDSDLSPPRNSKREKARGYDSDLSPPRNSKREKARGYDSDLSPPRSSRSAKYSNKNGSPRRTSDSRHNSKNYDSDLSPPRQSRRKETKSRWDDNSRKSLTPEKNKNGNKGKKTLDGTSAGLQNLKSLKEEEEALKKREQAMMQRMTREVSGRGQSTIVRDRRTGRRRDLGQESLEKLEKQKAQDAIDEKYAQWGKGLKQVNDRNAALKNDLYEMSKPLARYANDEDLERELKMRDRDDDPMLEYCRKKEIEAGKRAPANPKFQGSFMPNRFGIPPGHRWDGVDRSNGYERKWFEARNTKKAVEEEAYKWSTADM